MKNNIKELLKVKKMTQRDLAVICKIDQSYLNRLIRGDMTPGIVRAQHIARALGKRVDEVFIL